MESKLLVGRRFFLRRGRASSSMGLSLLRRGVRFGSTGLTLELVRREVTVLRRTGLRLRLPRSGFDSAGSL